MQQQAATQVEPNIVNGIDMDILLTTIQAVANEPELGQCKFRASNKWRGGSKNETTITGFYGAGEEHTHKQSFVYQADEPPILAGCDDDANPVEYVLHALAACVTTTMVAHGAVRGINIESISCELEGDLDMNGFFGINPDTPKGYTDIRMQYDIKADVENVDDLKQLAQFSPVYNMVSKGVNVEVEVNLQ
jgi:uncharacterized OsmC-like protein